MRKLVICSAGPALPEEAIVSKQAVIGMSGSGKTQTARKLAEAMMDIDQHVTIFDPTGAWWGLRSSADGLSEGYPIVVFGGSHSDAPLRADSGAMLARAVLKERFNAIFDMSLFASAEMRRFTTDFLNVVNLHNQHPLHIFFDEFDIVCPQAKSANSEESREAINTTVRRTRIKGIGVTMITQNPQDADKSVLNMADTVIAMRTAGSQAIDAIRKWMGRNSSADDIARMTSVLPEQPTGHGWIWSPQLKIFELCTFALCKTFDSGKTPKLGERILPPKVMAKVDIASLGKKIEDQVKEEQENDTAFLKEKIRRLEAQPKSTDDTERVMGLMEQVAEVERERDEFKAAAERVPELERDRDDFREFVRKGKAILSDLIMQCEEIYGESPLTPQIAVRPARLAEVLQSDKLFAQKDSPKSHESHVEVINGPQQRILNAIATLSASRAGSVSLEWIAATAGTTPRARGFEENMRQLKNKGYVDGITLTPAGAALATASSTVPTFEAMLSRLSVMLPTPQINILRELKRGPHSPEILAEVVGTTVRARGFEENIRQLRKRDYVLYGAGNYSLVPWLERLR